MGVRNEFESDFGFIVITPPGAPDASLAIAGARAGALGVLNLEFACEPGAAIGALATLATYAAGRHLGVLVDPADDDHHAVSRALDHPAAEALEAIILGGPSPRKFTNRQLKTLVRKFRGESRRVYVIARSIEEAEAAQAAGADGVLAKGHEAGGWVGDETTFILLQRLLSDEKCVGMPVWAHGGVGLHTLAAIRLSGAAGAVLDSQLLLARESPLAGSIKDRIAAMDGSETVCLGSDLGTSFRTYSRPGLQAVDEFQSLLQKLEAPGSDASIQSASWLRHVRERVDWQDANLSALAIGQDAAFAAGLARSFGSVSGILAGLQQAADSHLRTIAARPPLAENAPLAEALGTRYPILQGPMTRVSDRAEFAAAVAAAGALPFLALALMRAPEVRALLEQTRDMLSDRPWGVGILGFVPPELRAEQLAVIHDYRPPYALIAGGRPSQARQLDEVGTSTYLHVPSPALLELFLQEGARRFVFEGRECGGHVGPRTSFVLWESMIDVLLRHTSGGAATKDYHIIFAGGIHDDRSAAMVSALAAPLVERGMRIGVLVGTAYLFTHEAVASGAITEGFQRAALACTRTALLESGPGQSTRCAPSPFVDEFVHERRRLQAMQLTPDELRNELELLNVGRLRIASKGVEHNLLHDVDPNAPRLIAVDEEEQRRRGMYMLGQVAALRSETVTLEALHAQISTGSAARLEVATVQPAKASFGPRDSSATAVAIVGLACIVPGAADARTFWANVCNKVDAITEVPASRWDWRQYFDADRGARDKVYSRWGGFIEPVPFDAAEFGMPPNSLRSIEPFQLLSLIVVRRALEDAGYLSRPFERERASVILGAGGGGGDLSTGYVVRSMLPTLFGESGTELTRRLNALPEWTEDSFAGLLMNVAAGRAANRLDLGGVNFTVDAACASSLAAVYLAVRELESRTSDVVIAGGADAIENPFAFLCFSKTQALSPTGRCRPFDADADGIAISEGFAAVVLKRLEDAERDGDRIYAVIHGVGGSSDGRDRSLTAPRPEGQLRALERAYAHAQFSAATVGLIEAHGTGTAVGDKTEVESLTRFFNAAGAARQSTAIGSIKSMIGHTKASAGVVGLIKVGLSLYHKILPPTIGVTEPNPKADFPSTPFYVNTEVRPWVRPPSSPPRRAGVEAFGFGGTNFHVAMQEYTGEYLPPACSTLDDWPAELFVWRGPSSLAVLHTVSELRAKLTSAGQPRLVDLAASIGSTAARVSSDADASVCLAIVATSMADLSEKLKVAEQFLRSNDTTGRLHDPRGVHCSDNGLAQSSGRTAFLFPGQGSQYVNMARDIATLFPRARACFDRADEILGGRLPTSLTRLVFPISAFTEEALHEQRNALMQTDVAQPALGATSLAYLSLLKWLGLRPDMVAGHSFGEFVALHAAGCLDEATLLQLAEARGRFIREGLNGDDGGSMAAIDADANALRTLLAACDVVLANLNAPQQTVISGTRHAVGAAIAICAAAGIHAQLLPVACAFHSPLVAPAQERLADLLRQTRLDAPRLPVYSNTTAAPYPSDIRSVVELLTRHLVQPVNFLGEIRALHAAGARVFVEVGPRAVLSGLVERILGPEFPHICVPLDLGGTHAGLTAFLNGLAALAAEGAPLKIERLFEGRSTQRLEPVRLEREATEPRYTPTTWLVDGGRAWPANEPRPVTTPVHVIVADHEVKREAAMSDLSYEPLVLNSQVPPSSGQQPPGADILAAPDAAADVMRQFQGVMQHFLDTQGAIMLAYLGAQNSQPTPVHTPALAAPAPVPLLPDLPPPTRNGHVVEDMRPEPAPQLAADAEPSAMDRRQLQDLLIKLVGERTGYPPEMLSLDADIEADLGIDSIKRVEIAGTLLNALPKELTQSADIEEFTKLRTLRGVLDLLGGVAARPFERRVAANSPIGRYTLRLANAPKIEQTRALPGKGVVAIVDDEGGVGEALEAILRERGHAAVRVSPSGRPESIASQVEWIHHEFGQVKALVHLTGLRPPVDQVGLDPDRWTARWAEDVRALFIWIKALLPDLERGAEGAAVLAATRGGVFGTQGLSAEERFDGYGGVAGLLKTLALEVPTLRVKCVDVGSTDAAQAADYLQGELEGDDDLVEVGYRDAHRMMLELTPATIEVDALAQAPLDDQSVVLITGGARGITAEVALMLARSYRPILFIVGRTPWFAEPESATTAGVNDAAALRRTILEQLRQSDPGVTPVQVEAAYRQLMAEREVRTNLARLEATGASVTYRRCDVTDRAAVAALIDEMYAAYGRIDCVIHGAGVIEDKLVRDKRTESFDRVVAAKLSSAVALASCLRVESLRWLVFFSSVAARFGNPGQGDYAAANDGLNKLAQYLDRRWPARVVAINWGPWLSRGMVSPEIQQKFAERGVALIPVETGCTMLQQELEAGYLREPEIVIGGRSAQRPEWPLLARSTCRRGLDGSVEITRTLDPSRDVFLRDHTIDGQPILPFAMVMELMAEAAAWGWPDLELNEIRDVQLLNGISVPESGQTLRLQAIPRQGLADNHGLTIDMSIWLETDPLRAYYRASVHLAQPVEHSREVQDGVAPLGESGPLALSIAEAYRKWLFHGPRFQHILGVEAMGLTGARSIVMPSSPADCVAEGRRAGDWLIDPVVVDCALQVNVLWARQHWDVTLLPSSLVRYRRFAHIEHGRPIRHELRIKPETKAPVVFADHYFYSDDGRLLGTLEGMQGTGSRALNRLAATAHQ